MAVRATYIYKVMMGRNGEIEETRYCYARNATVAKSYYKEKLKDKKYDTFILKAFGDTDIRKHPGPFAEMPEDEIKYIKDKNLGKAERYSNRKDHRNIPINAEFVPVDKES